MLAFSACWQGMFSVTPLEQVIKSAVYNIPLITVIWSYTHSFVHYQSKVGRIHCLNYLYPQKWRKGEVKTIHDSFAVSYAEQQIIGHVPWEIAGTSYGRVAVT